jgi:hypothetical protein
MKAKVHHNFVHNYEHLEATQISTAEHLIQKTMCKALILIISPTNLDR